VDYLLNHWTPAGQLIVDPCACGYNGWTIGQAVAGRHGRTFECSDIRPMHDMVTMADFRDVRITQPATVVTNPPYDQLTSGDFMCWAWSQPGVIEVVVLVRFGFICAENGARAVWLERWIQPPKRFAFEVLPEDVVDVGGKLILASSVGQKTPIVVVRDASTLTGYRLSVAGVDHGWAVYRRGHDGAVELVIKPISPKQGSLF